MQATATLRDALTDLPSRELLREHLGVSLTRATHSDGEVALLHLGVDSFHFVNDSLGRPAGDDALREIARRLRDAVPEPHLMARSGGDEFCVLLADLRPGTTEEIVEALAGQIAVALLEPLSIEGREFLLTISTGASVFPADAQDAETMLRHADSAMHECKQNGPGGVAFYSGGGTSDALNRLLLTAQLRTALAEQQFELHFQPIVDLVDGSVTAVEALLRWRDPLRGIIPPLDFIGVAEHTGLIIPIGEWVMDAVCAQSREWRDAGIPVTIAFNVSLRQFRDPQFAGNLHRRIAAHDVDPSTLIVEITESTAMRDPVCVEPVLQQLRDIGARVAIDDFGIGYSSLGRLRDMAVDVLKVDGAFLPQAGEEDGRAEHLLSATLALGNALGLATVAEGVETEQQHALLVERGCPLAQGFHLFHPLPADEASAVLRASVAARPAA